jgi:hypothetical protein
MFAPRRTFQSSLSGETNGFQQSTVRAFLDTVLETRRDNLFDTEVPCMANSPMVGRPMASLAIPKEGTMGKTTLLAALAAALMVVCLCCKNNAKMPKGDEGKNAGMGNVSPAKESDKPEMPTQAEIETAKAVAEKLLPNFYCFKNEFDKMQVYVHKIREKTRTTILVDISGDSLIDSSEYYAKDWIFHDRFYIKIDEEIVTVKMSEPRCKVLTSNLVYERASPLPIPTMVDIAARFIAANPDKEVRVRLEGSGGKHDYTLDKKVQEAICQTVELYDALMILKRAGIDPLTDLKAKPTIR